MISLKGHTAIVTGASRGIGRATSLILAQAGADVVINYWKSDLEARQLGETIRAAGSRYLLVQADVSKAAQVKHLFETTKEHFGRLDLVVANAGIWEGGKINELTEMEWDRTMEANLKSVFLCCRHAAEIMKKQHRGNIITISSTAGQRGESLYSNYAASKGAIISFTKSLATELGPHNINVNCVAPGWVDTDMTSSALCGEDLLRIISEIPLGRVAEATDIAGPILFLASGLARHITGDVINVNGGSVLCG